MKTKIIIKLILSTIFFPIILILLIQAAYHWEKSILKKWEDTLTELKTR